MQLFPDVSTAIDSAFVPETPSDKNDESQPDALMTKCDGCGRSFNPKAFLIHTKICAKVSYSEIAHAAECHVRPWMAHMLSWPATQ